MAGRWLLLILVLLWGPARGETPATTLEESVRAVVQSSEAMRPAGWGLLVVDATGTEVLSIQADRLFVPASTLKTFVGAALPARVGLDHRYRTELWHGPQGLVLKGWGDPSLETHHLVQMVESLGSLRQVNGIGVDDSLFDTLRYGAGWAWDDIGEDYSAPMGALCLNRNLVQVRLDWHQGRLRVLQEPVEIERLRCTIQPGAETDIAVRYDVDMRAMRLDGVLDRNGVEVREVAVPDGAQYAGRVLKRILQEHGVVVRGEVQRRRASGRLVAVHESEPLSHLLGWMLKRSDNLYAEQFLKTLGLGTTAAGVRQELSILFPGQTPIRLVDGSGLSRYNLITPRQLVHVMRNYYLGTPLESTLAVAGEDGTLSTRWTASPVRRQFVGKTGTMSGVSGLVGVLTTTSAKRYVVAFLCNGYIGPSRPIKAVEDRLIEVLRERLE